MSKARVHSAAYYAESEFDAYCRRMTADMKMPCLRWADFEGRPELVILSIKRLSNP